MGTGLFQGAPTEFMVYAKISHNHEFVRYLSITKDEFMLGAPVLGANLVRSGGHKIRGFCTTCLVTTTAPCITASQGEELPGYTCASKLPVQLTPHAA